MKQSKANGSIHRKYLTSALISIGVSYGLSGCGGGSSAPAAVAPHTTNRQYRCFRRTRRAINRSRQQYGLRHDANSQLAKFFWRCGG
jgi:hypothetical protein